ncbi:unnamed protein product [Enterobius vermicularis]|uniref:Uncharacterized protein n=1 Tax=Enterobius vermicularis TaxID=51028 RepID=A0A0N4V623_ENTVE|nr:unnamed protein product [Enterobius vermicularis]
MRVNNTVDICAPEYLKWHYLRNKDKFLLTKKVAGRNEFCALPVDKPSLQTLENTPRFDYSAYPVVQNNMYCVHLKSGSFSFECDSSFMSLHRPNLLYIVNIRPHKNEWEILPLEVLENAELKKHGRSGVVPQEAWGLSNLSPPEILIEIDATLNKRYVARRGSNFLLEYPLKLLRKRPPQRPRMIAIDKMDGDAVRIWSFSIDNGKILLTELRKDAAGNDVTFVYGVNIAEPQKVFFLLSLNYKAEINFWNISSLRGNTPKHQQEHRRHPTKTTTTQAPETLTPVTRRTDKDWWTTPKVVTVPLDNRWKWTVTTTARTTAPLTMATTMMLSTTTAASEEVQRPSRPTFSWRPRYQEPEKPEEEDENDDDGRRELSSTESDSKIEDTGVSTSEHFICVNVKKQMKRERKGEGTW